jgi:hypothetical protein
MATLTECPHCGQVYGWTTDIDGDERECEVCHKSFPVARASQKATEWYLNKLAGNFEEIVPMLRAVKSDVAMIQFWVVLWSIVFAVLLVLSLCGMCLWGLLPSRPY